MRWLIKLVLIIAANALGLYLSARFVPGFRLQAAAAQLVQIAFVLTLLNAFLKPLLKLIFSPLIVLTLGLALLLVNMIILYLLDFFFLNLTIEGVSALVLSSIILAVTNMAAHTLIP